VMRRWGVWGKGKRRGGPRGLYVEKLFWVFKKGGGGDPPPPPPQAGVEVKGCRNTTIAAPVFIAPSAAAIQDSGGNSEV